MVGGVDTHGDVHVAAVVDTCGRILGTQSFAATATGYRRLLGWMRAKGVVVRVGVEGTGSWGAGLARHLAAEGVEVVEVDRPDRQARRAKGKYDPVDAEAAARAALNGQASGTPKARTGPIEAIRALRVARRSAMKARTQALGQLRALVSTAPEELRARLRPLPTAEVVRVAARYRVADPTTALAATKLALKELALRVGQLDDQVDRLDAVLEPLVRKTCPALVARDSPATSDIHREGMIVLADCGDFDVVDFFVIDARLTVFSDADGIATRIVFHGSGVDNYTNSATSKSYAGEFEINETIDVATGADTSRGVLYQLTIPGHGVVFMDVGRIVIQDGEVTFSAGHHQLVDGDTATLCAALA